MQSNYWNLLSSICSEQFLFIISSILRPKQTIIVKNIDENAATAKTNKRVLMSMSIVVENKSNNGSGVHFIEYAKIFNINNIFVGEYIQLKPNILCGKYFKISSFSIHLFLLLNAMFGLGD